MDYRKFSQIGADKSPLRKARVLGSAHGYYRHWWLQRVTAGMLVPLALWFVFTVATHQLSPYEQLVVWLHNPFVAAVIIVYFGALFLHGMLGLQVVVEDYVNGPSAKALTLGVVNFVVLLVGTAAIVSVFKLAFGGM